MGHTDSNARVINLRNFADGVRGGGYAKPTVTRGQTEPKADQPENILIVAQAGRLEYEALIFVASLRLHSPDYKGRLIVAEPQPSAAWDGCKTLISPEIREALTASGAEILPFTAEYFGASYPYGNKIEVLKILPEKETFAFFDTDSLIARPLGNISFDFNRPSASMRREGTWPVPPIYGPGYGGIWKSLYDRFDLNFDSTLDLSQPDEHWERYLYFNAGWFFGADPAEFGRRFLKWALAVRDDPNEELACQSLEPWLDQVVLPLVIHSFGGGRPGSELTGLDGDVTCHYRKLPLLYAREGDDILDALETAVASNEIKKLLREWTPARKLIYQKKGREKIRPLFDQNNLPVLERQFRQVIKKNNWWLV